MFLPTLFHPKASIDGTYAVRHEQGRCSVKGVCNTPLHSGGSLGVPFQLRHSSIYRRQRPTAHRWGLLVLLLLCSCQREDAAPKPHSPAQSMSAEEKKRAEQESAAHFTQLLKKVMTEPYEEIHRQKVDGMEVILGRLKQQRLPSYGVVFAFQSDKILFHEAEAKGLKRAHALRLGLKEKVTITQHFQRPPTLPFRTDITLSLRMQMIRENAEECVQMTSPADNTIQTAEMPRATILALDRVGRFSDTHIELLQEPNKRTIRRFAMGDQEIFFNRLLTPTSRPTNTKPQKLLMIQGRFLLHTELFGLSEEALGETLRLWVDDDREANFTHKRFKRKKQSIHFSLHTYNAFPPTDLRRFRLCFFSPAAQRRAQRTFHFKDVLLK